MGSLTDITTALLKTSLNHCINYTFFKNANSSSAILFIHGLGSSQNFYYSIAKKLSHQNNHSCIIFDNFGASSSSSNLDFENISQDLTVESIKQDVVDLLLHLKIKKVILAGHSMGGMSVNYITATTPNLDIVGNILVNPVHPTPKLKEIFDSRINTLLKTNDISSIANGVAENAVGSNCLDIVKAFIRDLVSRQTIKGYILNCKIISHAATLTTQYINYYKQIKTPTLIIAGKEDLTAPWSGCVEVIAQNLGSETISVKQLEGVGHWAAVESDEKVYKLISDFVPNDF
ncbi:alpha/beta fold hydrolase [Ascoidea rubescens DSM 1968]|uniref:Alpha/beta-hydrolase n=1 Tax=Ascoidea rubescens DSM 1968 TaxID=1344418 RepID=A0A1D2VK24_9ASCO|nr:alpha/beta-hydrolase [Ascoidea rubescens DSM 1968]ODV61972.1 alpha/beta-hydrolase [Ascoidea rubescens DSM 1968]